MTKDQITHLKSVFSFNKDGKPLAYSTTAILNDHNALNNMKDMLVWDDNHELVIGVKVNEDQHSQTIAPIKVTACSYQELFFLDSIYSTENFEVAVDKLFSFLSEDQRKSMKEWAKKIPVQGNKIDRHVPYYGKEIDIKQDLNVPNMRSRSNTIDISPMLSQIRLQSELDNIDTDEFKSYWINGSCAVNELTFSKSCIYKSTGSNIISSNISVDTENAEFDGFVFKGRSLDILSDVIDDSLNLITVSNTCKSITFRNCSFEYGSGAYNSLLKILGNTKVIIDRCSFGNSASSSYNRLNYYIDIDQYTDGSSITFCNFHGSDINKANVRIIGGKENVDKYYKSNNWIWRLKEDIIFE